MAKLSKPEKKPRHQKVHPYDSLDMSLCFNWLFHVIDSCSFAVPAALLAFEGMLPTFERSMPRYGPFTKV